MTRRPPFMPHDLVDYKGELYEAQRSVGGGWLQLPHFDRTTVVFAPKRRCFLVQAREDHPPSPPRQPLEATIDNEYSSPTTSPKERGS